MLCLLSVNPKDHREIRGWLIARDLPHARIIAAASGNRGAIAFFTKLEKLPEPGRYEAGPSNVLLISPDDPGQEHSMLALPSYMVKPR